MSKLPDLEAWAIFAKVAETGSFARTANDLVLSQATVSKAITRLEARMKTNLFHRTSRRVMLTEAGKGALERAARILHEGEAVEADITEQSTSLRGLIRVAAPMSFGIARVATILPQFMASHPEVAIELHLADEQVDLIGERFDVALRIANMNDSSLIARQLCKVKLLLVGAPGYFERYGRPQHPKDLAHHKGLQYSLARDGLSWKFRHPEHGEFTQVMAAQLQVNNAEALEPVLLAGMGLAVQPAFLVWEAVRDGLLQVAMPQWDAGMLSLNIVTPPGRLRPARVRAFIDYAAQQFRHEPWAHWSEGMDESM
ncbi:LysR family transcriptional regulator [Lampropedia puyangensis]|uniref:LysR family transcriptional regulator n=1 Tax=Lampropedia puyangensis TaxID=1330072 RepID=A0A4S8EXQ7_9BURK|nr:LysR family transcriptional regulator [Lampropedia puyangensis]THT99328.1 LysR family transcriptional regulator [Lampropedia puyangensis]